VTRKQNFFGQLILAIDLIVLMASYMATYWVRARLVRFTPALLPISTLSAYVWLLPILLLSDLIALRYFELYNAITYRSPLKILGALIKTQTLAGLIIFSTMFILTAWGPSRSMMGLFILVSYLGLAAEKLSIYALMKYRWRLRRPTTAWKVLLVGSRADAEKYLDLVLQHPDWNREIVGIVSASPAGAPESGGHSDLHPTVEH
jgi:FlaA1/EpsC-like NDP-sugar epimerase